ncbi:helix-turn-helix domain-containing protein [Mycobacterium avium]|uniref:helix-turn-helix domain-containing protein n=1 Tax=Mycobacterium avium TaxID=1764 RepID=UPI001070D303|nr:helix-turn-helix domain-containing protein [Mycobacterium avium]
MAFSKLQYLKELHGAAMKDSTFRVMVTVFNYTNAEGRNAFPGNEALARDCNTSVSTVKRALKELTEKGWLIKVAPGGRGGDGAHWATKYDLGNRWCGETKSQRLTRDPSAGQIRNVTGSNRDISAGHVDDVNGSDPWSQWATDDPPSDHESTDHEITDHYSSDHEYISA